MTIFFLQSMEINRSKLIISIFGDREIVLLRIDIFLNEKKTRIHFFRLVSEFHISCLNNNSKIVRRQLLIDLTSYFLDRKHRLTTAPLTKMFFF